MGFVLWEGASLWDGTPVAAVATFGHGNRKVGEAWQVWIIPQEITPPVAAAIGADAAVCGDCSLRGSCYVILWQGPRAVFDAYHRGVYRKLAPHEIGPLLGGSFVRLGAWGDPAWIPRWVSAAAVSHARGHSGYTQGWRHGIALADLCMASTFTAADDATARAMGYRTYRVTAAGAPAERGAIVCPGSAERGKALQCRACKACDGTATGRRGHIRVAAHGSAKRVRVALDVVQGVRK